RPASIRSLCLPASISVLGPKRFGSGLGPPVPSSVTVKSLEGFIALTCIPVAGNSIAPYTQIADEDVPGQCTMFELQIRKARQLFVRRRSGIVVDAGRRPLREPDP